MTQHPDTPTSQFTAVRWTFYRRLGLLLRTRLLDDGTTYSLHDIASRTGGRVTVDELISLLDQGAQARPDAITCILLSHAFGVDPDFFVADAAVEDYVNALRQATAPAAQPSHLPPHPAAAATDSTRIPAATH